VLIVQAQVGRDRVELLVDSGSAITTLRVRAAERLGLPRSHFTGRRAVYTAAGTSLVVSTGRLPYLRIGSVEVQKVEVALLDLPVGVHVDGLLGINVLEHFRVTFDFRHAILVLRHESGRDGARGLRR
jgi:clan AA aspartic protease (TIGR02281 family)